VTHSDFASIENVVRGNEKGVKPSLPAAHSEISLTSSDGELTIRESHSPSTKKHQQPQDQTSSNILQIQQPNCLASIEIVVRGHKKGGKRTYAIHRNNNLWNFSSLHH
jgi:hypothetical protein